MKLNLGCGNDYKEGWINVDNSMNVLSEVVWNLDLLPYPFEEDSADEILLSHVLEHLENPLAVLEEMYRISKPSAKWTIIVPHYSNFTSYADLTHKRFFCGHSFNFLEKNPKYYNSNMKIKIVKRHYDSIRTKTFPFGAINFLAAPLLNLWPLGTEYWLSKLIPVSQITFVIEVKK